MSDGKPLIDSEPPSDEEIEAAAARLSAKWGSPAPKAEPTEQTPVEKPAAAQRTESAGPIVQTLEKGRTHMVTVEVRKARRRGTIRSADKQD